MCAALEGKTVEFDSLSATESEVLRADMAKDNFMTSLQLMMSTVQNLPGELQVRLNKAVTLKDVEKRAIPVTGS